MGGGATHSNLGALTLPSSAMGQTPFFLVYRLEAMLPLEVEHQSFIILNFIEDWYQEGRITNLDKHEEARDSVGTQSAKVATGYEKVSLSKSLEPKIFHRGSYVV